MEILGLLLLLLGIAIALYLFVQTPKFSKNRWIWAILGFFFDLLTLGIFFIKTKQNMLGLIFISVWIIIFILKLFFVLKPIILWYLHSDILLK